MDHEIEDHDRGLDHDLTVLAAQRRRAMGRRGLLGLVGGIGIAAVAGCGAEDSSSDGAVATSRSGRGAPPPGMAPGSATSVADGEIPEETAGPYPGDGSNGPDALTAQGVVRKDLTHSFGSASGIAEGVPVTVRLRVLDLNGDDVAPYAGAAVYLWHADREGRYSMYSDGVTEENYLRGVQVADDDGRLSFTTIFPACYDGRWPHMHFEVYQDLATATSAGTKLRTSQLALPKATCEQVYGVAEGYDASVANLAKVSLDTDMVFADGHSLQMPKVTGSVAQGYVVSLNVPI